jgi:plasmid stability protein
MADLILRDVDDTLIARLDAEARRHGRSLDQEVRRILAAAARPDRAQVLAELAEIRAMEQPGEYAPAEALVRADRDRR